MNWEETFLSVPATENVHTGPEEYCGAFSVMGTACSSAEAGKPSQCPSKEAQGRYQGSGGTEQETTL